MSKYLIDKYKRELKSYTFPENKYDMLMNHYPRKNDVLNESFNRNVLLNTPKEFYMNNGKIIYYDSLRKVNNNINEWIDIFNMKTKFTDNELDIYSFYVETLSRITKEINLFTKECASKYDLKLAINDNLSCTLVKAYINILWERKLKINNRLRIIMDSESFLCYPDYINELLELRDIYSTKLLCTEEEHEELYDEFKYIIRELLNKKKLIRKSKMDKEV